MSLPPGAKQIIASLNLFISTARQILGLDHRIATEPDPYQHRGLWQVVRDIVNEDVLWLTSRERRARDEPFFTWSTTAMIQITKPETEALSSLDEQAPPPATDHIQLPPAPAFRGPPEYAATVLHELGHWTGHVSRLNRDMRGRFGSAAYAMEELRAELASAFVANELGIPTDIPQHASYIADWI